MVAFRGSGSRVPSQFTIELFRLSSGPAARLVSRWLAARRREREPGALAGLADRAGSKHTGDSRNRGIAGLRAVGRDGRPNRNGPPLEIGDKHVAGARGADTSVRARAGIRRSRRRRGCLCPRAAARCRLRRSCGVAAFRSEAHAGAIPSTSGGAPVHVGCSPIQKPFDLVSPKGGAGWRDGNGLKRTHTHVDSR
jgi:hypothetical protein